MNSLQDTIPSIVIHQDRNIFNGSGGSKISNKLTFQFSGPIVIQCNELDLQTKALIGEAYQAVSNVVDAQLVISEVVDMMNAHHTGNVIGEKWLNKLFTPSNEAVLRNLLSPPVNEEHQDR